MKTSIIEIQEEVKISLEDKDIILEKGDKIEVLKEARIDRAYAKAIENTIVEATDDLPFLDAVETIWQGLNEGLGMGFEYEESKQALLIIKKHIERMVV